MGRDCCLPLFFPAGFLLIPMSQRMMEVTDLLYQLDIYLITVLLNVKKRWQLIVLVKVYFAMYTPTCCANQCYKRHYDNFGTIF